MQKKADWRQWRILEERDRSKSRGRDSGRVEGLEVLRRWNIAASDAGKHE